ncbi:MAG: primosomal protein N' [Bacteroidales bacterium]|nr:primosomal protein N' [Bacteroidales bacterium]
MKNTRNFVDVILPLPLPNLYTYEVGDTLFSKNIVPGIRVSVQFGKKKLYAALVKKVHQKAPADYETKKILSVLDEKPIVNGIQLAFWEWIAGYYMCTQGEVFKAAVPSGLKLESETRVIYREKEVTEFLNETETLVLDILEKENIMDVRSLSVITDKKDIMPVLKSLHEKGHILFNEQLKEAYTVRTERYIKLHASISSDESLNTLFDQLKRAPKQLELVLSYMMLAGYSSGKKYGEVKAAEVIKKAGANSTVLQALEKKGVFLIEEKETGRLSSASGDINAPVSLNKSQHQAYHEILAGFEKHDVVLLHGITSSGKTEIYIHLIEEQLKQKKQVLYLLPEIALTTQIIQRLQHIFGKKVGVYHSKFSDAERVEIWYNLLGEKISGSNRYEVILGVRSSVFLPYENLGLIIVDEEHENTYKQFDPAPRYHARDAAIVLAGLHGAKVLLGTATPSLESYNNASNGKYARVLLNERYLDMELPEIRVVDVKEARRKKQMKSFFSPPLIDGISEALKKNEQVILFQNRRGFSPYMQCETCGWIPKCKHCDVSLTYHKYQNQLVCHYCGFTLRNLITCSACGSADLLTRGFGTEKIEDEISLFFPEAKIARMDLDSTRKKKSYEQIISEFETGNVNILVGTQMVSKGLDFNNVKIVGILDADNMLNFPDFRSFERAFQLMAQVSGRAGRKTGRGVVYIQTSEPGHSILQHVVKNDFISMYREQLAERKTFFYPPFNRLIKLTVKHKNRDVVNQASGQLAGQLRTKLGKRVVGPEFPLVSRVQNWYQKCILLKLDRNKSISQIKIFIQDQVNILLSMQEFKSVLVINDVDPM